MNADRVKKQPAFERSKEDSVLPRPPLPRTFAQLTDPLLPELELLPLLRHLSKYYLQLFDAASLVAFMENEVGELEVLFASDEPTRLLAAHELQDGEGPSVEAFMTGATISVDDLLDEDAWPNFRLVALTTGCRAVHSFPLRFGAAIVGTLEVACLKAGVLSEEDLHLGEALADVLAVAIIQNRANREASTANQQLQRALRSRVVIEQAKGILAERHGLDMNQAFDMIRRHSRNTNQRLLDTALAVVEGDLGLEAPLLH